MGFQNRTWLIMLDVFSLESKSTNEDLCDWLIISKMKSWLVRNWQNNKINLLFLPIYDSISNTFYYANFND